MIECQSLTKQYGRLRAVDDLSFRVQPGEVLGFLGPNGAGKTTTMRIVAGFLPPTSGRVLFENKGQRGSRAVSEETAFLMAQMLKDVVDAGTGYRAREAGFRFPAAGKTGTTNDYRDAWFIGFTPRLVTSVWVGFDKPKTIMAGGYAGQLAAPIWGRFMRDSTAVGGWVSQPAGVTAAEICQASGQLASEGCRRAVAVDAEGNETSRPMVSWEYFRRGTEPTDECPIHGFPQGGSDPWRSIIGPTRRAIDGVTAPTPYRQIVVPQVPPNSTVSRPVAEPAPLPTPAAAPVGPAIGPRPPDVKPVPSISPKPTPAVQQKGVLSTLKRLFTRAGKGGT